MVFQSNCKIKFMKDLPFLSRFFIVSWKVDKKRAPILQVQTWYKEVARGDPPKLQQIHNLNLVF